LSRSSASHLSWATSARGSGLRDLNLGLVA
jgi:hypothetical protein